MDDDERRVLRELAEAGLPLPEQGYETESGFPVDIAWPDYQVAVVFSDDQVDDLTRDGWKVVASWDNDLPARLKTLLGADDAGGG